jgi:predicted nucleotidyltransferase
MLDEIRAKRDEIYAVARAHKAEKLWVFGSCARKEETPESDVDFLVEFMPTTTIFDYVKIKDSLSKIIGRNVDVVDSFALERGDRFSKEVVKDKVAV